MSRDITERARQESNLRHPPPEGGALSAELRARMPNRSLFRMPRVLVVDDDPQVVRLLRVNLELEGYDVVSASDGNEALAAVASEDPDLVVCDVMMPGMDGVEVVRRLRADNVTLPVVMLSAKAMRSDMRAGLDAGANEYVTKPFDPTELIDVVDRLLGRK
jgi:DNA-binding response OmpR family regulator